MGLWGFSTCTIVFCFTIYAENDNCDVTKLLISLKPYQITIFKDVSIKQTKEQNLFFQNIVSQSLSVLIELTDIEKTKDNRILNKTIFKNPWKSSVYIILAQENGKGSNLKEKFFIINTIIELSSIPTRPKCLLIFWKKNFGSEDGVKKILHYAWNKKFLDFIVLIKSSFNSSVFINYNPFTQTYNVKYLKNTSEIFPDKLIDVNKYPLIMPVFHSMPDLTYEEDENGTVVKVWGDEYAYIEIILCKLNFSP